MKKKPTLYVLTNNHFDLTWRRCWQRPLEFKGDVFVSYADIEDFYITDNLAMARRNPRYKFSIESTAVARNYLRRHPRQLAELRKLVAAGRLEVSGAGDNIIDGNMVLGESIVRNFVTGLLWAQNTLGQTTRRGIRNDAFGNPAQLPQIFRQCEIAWVTGISYSPVRGEYWRGLDGSTIFTGDIPRVGGDGGCDKYPPCPHCHGRGCRRCNHRGIHEKLRCRLPQDFDEKLVRRAGVAQVARTPEELLPNPAIIDWAARLAGRYDVRFAIGEEIFAQVADKVARVDDPPAALLHNSLEANPNNSGCLVTRIKLKQIVRGQEYALLTAETLAALASVRGATYPAEALSLAWEKLLFMMFHDAVTATHVDEAYREQIFTAAEIEALVEGVRKGAAAALASPAARTVSVFNPTHEAATQVVTAEVPGTLTGAKVVDASGRPAKVVSCLPRGGGKTGIEFIATAPAMGASEYRFSAAPRRRPVKLAQPVIENARFRVEGDAQGLLRIVDKRLGRPISERRTYRPNELILERDEGSPWTTLNPHRDRQPLAGSTELVAAERTPAYQRLHFKTAIWGRVANSGGFECGSTITLYDGIDRVDFEARVDWRTFNYRLRIAMPAPFVGSNIYGIPYGMIERQPYAPQFGQWTMPNGDWPAVNWAGIQSPRASVALLNRGLPSYGMEPDGPYAQTMLLSVLRSPAIPTFLHEPQYYTMTDYDGMRDEGHHHFHYALAAYDTPFADSRVVADAEAYNAGLAAVNGRLNVSHAPQVQSDNIRLAAVKRSEDGRSIILRLAEYRGRDGVASILFNGAVPPSSGSPKGAAWGCNAAESTASSRSSKTPPSFAGATLEGGTVGPIRSAARTNLLERGGEPLEIADGKITLKLRPWEIATVRVEM